MSPSAQSDVSHGAGTGSHSFVFLCDDYGQMIQEYGEQLPCWGEPISFRSLMSIIEIDTFADFLKYIRMRGAALGWRVLVYHMGSYWTLILNGARTPGGILVFAYLTPDSAALDKDTYRYDYQEPARPVNPDGGRDNAELRKAIHDLKNPISSILSSCDYLSAYSEDQFLPDQQEMISGIEASARALLDITDRIHKLNCGERG